MFIKNTHLAVNKDMLKWPNTLHFAKNYALTLIEHVISKIFNLVWWVLAYIN